AFERRPKWMRDLDLTLSIRTVGGRLQASLDPGLELEQLFGGKQLDPDGHPRWLNTGMLANEVPTLEGQLYLALAAEIKNDQSLKSVLTGSTSRGQGPINDMLLAPDDQRRLVKVLSERTGAWYRELFVTGANADLREMMESF